MFVDKNSCFHVHVVLLRLQTRELFHRFLQWCFFSWFSIHNQDLLMESSLLEKESHVKDLTFVKLTQVSQILLELILIKLDRENKKRLNTFQWFLYLFGLDNIPFKKGNMGIFTQKLMFSDIQPSLSFFPVWSETRERLQLADMTSNGFHQSEGRTLTCAPSVRSGLGSIHSSRSSPGLLTFPSFGCIDI